MKPKIVRTPAHNYIKFKKAQFPSLYTGSVASTQPSNLASNRPNVSYAEELRTDVQMPHFSGKQSDLNKNFLTPML